jgi:hypothetical protein
MQLSISEMSGAGAGAGAGVTFKPRLISAVRDSSLVYQSLFGRVVVFSYVYVRQTKSALPVI